MKRAHQQVVFGIFVVLICVLLSGCTIGKYHLLDTHVDENGEQYFMGFGETGPSGGEGTGKNENFVKETDSLQENETSDDQENIVGTLLKRGWTSSDHSILKGKNVSVKGDSILFSIDLRQEKEVVISCDIVLDEGEYQLVYISPDGTEKILQDGETIRAEETLLFTQGKNEISVLSNHAVFQEIDISITGIEISDF